MWILDSLSRVPVKKLFLLLSVTLGAGFLLLAHLFSINGFRHPITYAAMATALYFANRNAVAVWKICLLIPASYLLAHYLMPQYPVLFSIAFAGSTGFVLYRPEFRIWKWAASATLFFLSLAITGVWQQINFVYQYVPLPAIPLVHGLILSFCAGCSFLPYSLRKDRVQEAFDATSWMPRSESEALAKQASDLYRIVREQLDLEPRLQEDLEEFCERIVLLCRRYQDITAELTKADPEELENQIGALKAKAESVTDGIAKRQYEQAIENKEKQRKQYESLRNKSERLRAQLMHYVSGLENMRFAYANREFRTAGDSKESIEFFLNLTRADNVYDASEAYQQLL